MLDLRLTSRTSCRMLDDIACAIAASAPTVCRTLVVHGDVAQELDRIAAAEDAVLLALGPSRHTPSRRRPPAVSFGASSEP